MKSFLFLCLSIFFLLSITLIANEEDASCSICDPEAELCCEDFFEEELGEIEVCDCVGYCKCDKNNSYCEVEE